MCLCRMMSRICLRLELEVELDAEVEVESDADAAAAAAEIGARELLFGARHRDIR